MTEGVVYFIMAADTGHIKIGKTSGSPFARMREFQTGNAIELQLLVAVPGYTDLEKKLHKRFANCHVRGEWFKPDVGLVSYIDGAMAAIGAPVEVQEPEERWLGLTSREVEALAEEIVARREMQEAECRLAADAADGTFDSDEVH